MPPCMAVEDFWDCIIEAMEPALDDSCYEALTGLIRPYNGLRGPYKALEVLIRPLRAS